ncbi:MAG TPA: hypothetical protein VJR89_06060, partial [Polyangiales bacterium]|nr:hypothetical protein [Polyangiales bacterium]
MNQTIPVADRDLPGLPQPGDLVAGKYCIEQRLGSGGMGAVFAAHHTITRSVSRSNGCCPS